MTRLGHEGVAQPNKGSGEGISQSKVRFLQLYYHQERILPLFRLIIESVFEMLEVEAENSELFIQLFQLFFGILI
jgi:hypothetical protein